MPRKKTAAQTFSGALEHLQGKNNTLSASAIAALTGAGKKELAAFAKTWVLIPVERRRRVARMMVELAEQDFKLDYNLLFRYFLNDEDALVRVSGIEGLWEDEDAALVKPMIGFLRSDPDARVRAAAADSLGRFMLLAEYGRLGESQAQLISEALLATTRSASEDLVVRCRAVEALAYWSNDIVREIIEAAYEDDAPEMRASAVAAMGRTADAFWRKITLDELESPNARMRFEAARASGELENREATARLIELLDDADREVQSAAVSALGQIGGKRAKQALIDAAASEDEALSGLATEALQEVEFASGSDLMLFDLEVDQDKGIELDEDDELESDQDDELNEEEWDDDMIEDEE